MMRIKKNRKLVWHHALHKRSDALNDAHFLRQ